MASKVHHSVTQERVVEAYERYETTLENPGICLGCGAERDGCESDAVGYKCEDCDSFLVMGIGEILLTGLYH